MSRINGAKRHNPKQSVARIERWRRHAENKLAQLKDKPRLLEELRLIAEFENKSPLEVVMDRLMSSRGNAEIVFDVKPRLFPMPLYRAQTDTIFERSHSPRTRDAHEEDVVNMAVHMLLGQIPGCVPLREKRNLKRFYRKGDHSLFEAGIRAMRYALSEK